MAAPMLKRGLDICKFSRPGFRRIHAKTDKIIGNKKLYIGLPCACYAAVLALKKMTNSRNFVPVVNAAQPQQKVEETKPEMTYREIRFQQFASVEFEGVIYMTPQDFLESVTEDAPRHLSNGSSARIGRTRLEKKEVDGWLKNTPDKRKGSDKLFRSMHCRGLISYTEYLFLLCVLTKPQSGFGIAFNMFDTDGNQIVDKKEFLVLESFFTLPPHERKFVPRERKHLQALLDLESVFSKQRDTKGRLTTDIGEKSIDPIQDTTLLIHFFGKRGNDVLKYEDFHRFMENLQSEVIELEFMEFSKGMETISEEDFAHILLRYTNLDKLQVGECIARVRSRMPEEKGITFQEFKKFCQFMNSLDDFTIAMNMYTYAEMPVSQVCQNALLCGNGLSLPHIRTFNNQEEGVLRKHYGKERNDDEFQRAVKICTGFRLSSHIVNTVFNIFDIDGDGHLSYKEFISIMKDRKHRGSRSNTMHHQRSWEAFKTCVKTEMKSY